MDLKSKILEKTDNGLLIITDLFSLPANVVAIENGEIGLSKQKFTSPWRTDDKDPSAQLWKRQSDGVWGIKDWGDGDARNFRDCFKLYADDNHIHNDKVLFLELARKYGCELDFKSSQGRKGTYIKLDEKALYEITEKAQYNRKVKGSDTETEYCFIQTTDWTQELASVFNTRCTGNKEDSKEWYNSIIKSADEFKLKPVSYYEIVTVNQKPDGGKSSIKGRRVDANKSYPIFAFERGKWAKIYQPYDIGWTTKEGDKVKPTKFFFVGEKQQRYMFGLEEIEAISLTERKSYLQKLIEEAESQLPDGEDLSTRKRNALNKQVQKYKLPHVVIASGGSDGINIRSVGDYVCFLNSETETLYPDQYQRLKHCAQEIYWCSDRDAAGDKAAHRVGMQYLDVKLIRLPSDLAERNSWANKPCKDVKDFLRYYTKHDWDGLKEVAYQYQFWQRKFDQKNQPRGYAFDLVNAKHFLTYQGFYRYGLNDKLAYEMVKLDDHIIKPQNNVTIKNYLENFAYESRQPKEVMEVVMKAKIISEQVIHSLPFFKNNFNKGSETHQYMFFKDRAWKVTASGAVVEKPSKGTYHVWEDEILIPQFERIEIQTPFFTIAKKTEGKLVLTIHRQDHPFIQFLINASRIHWRKEFDAAGVGYYETNEYYAERGLNTLTGKFLSTEEQEEQCRHFMSKVTAIGYYHHSYKLPSKAWLVWCTDNKARDISASQGRSGKSLLGLAIKRSIRTEYFEGRRTNIMDNFHFQNVTEKTDLIWYDDVVHGFSISPIYSAVTGAMKTRGLYKADAEIPFSLSPRFFVTSNFNLKDLDASTMERTWFLSFSDFYHGAADNYPGKKTVADDLCEQLFQNWDFNRESGYYNIVKDCLAAWLGHSKIDPPMQDITQQNLRTAMGSNFMAWAEQNLLSQEPSLVNYKLPGTAEPKVLKPDSEDIFIPKSWATDSFGAFLKKSNSKEQVTPDSFTRKLKAFCQYHNLILDPAGCKNSRGAIEKRMDDVHKKKFSLPAETVTLHCHYLMAYRNELPPKTADNLPF
jgi:hypothetical protein